MKLLIVYVCYFLNLLKKNRLVKVGILTHHIPGIILIIPVNLYYSNNILFQQIPHSLLAGAWFQILSIGIARTLNLQDLFERTRFTVYTLLGLLCAMYSRLYWFPIASYEFYMHNEINWFFTVVFSIDAICMTAFNFVTIGLTINRLLKIMFRKSNLRLKHQENYAIDESSRSNLLTKKLKVNKTKLAH